MPDVRSGTVLRRIRRRRGQGADGDPLAIGRHLEERHFGGRGHALKGGRRGKKEDRETETLFSSPMLNTSES